MSSVALVVLDTVRKDSFNKHFDWLPGIRFDNAWSTSHWTAPAHASILTGRYPTEHGTHAKNQFFTYNQDSLTEKLRKNGYSTYAYSSNPTISPAFDFNRGFDSFEGNFRVRALSDDVFGWDSFFKNHRSSGIERYPKAVYGCLNSDSNTIKSLKHGAKMFLHNRGLFNPVDSGATECLKWIDAKNFSNDSFLFLNLMEAHTPLDEIPDRYRTHPEYSPPEGLGFHTQLGKSEARKVRTAYEDSIKYLSIKYKEIFNSLIDDFDYLITTSDHGELLGESGRWGHDYGIYPKLTNIPLVISGKSETQPSQDKLVGLNDLYATILDWTNTELRKENPSVPIFSDDNTEMHLVEGHGFRPRKMQMLRELGINPEKYDEDFRGIVRDSNFGFETADGWQGSVDPKHLEEMLEQITKASENEATITDQKVLNQLQDLGYV